MTNSIPSREPPSVFTDAVHGTAAHGPKPGRHGSQLSRGLKTAGAAVFLSAAMLAGLAGLDRIMNGPHGTLPTAAVLTVPDGPYSLTAWRDIGLYAQATPRRSTTEVAASKPAVQVPEPAMIRIDPPTAKLAAKVAQEPAAPAAALRVIAPTVRRPALPAPLPEVLEWSQIVPAIVAAPSAAPPVEAPLPSLALLPRTDRELLPAAVATATRTPPVVERHQFSVMAENQSSNTEPSRLVMALAMESMSALPMPTAVGPQARRVATAAPATSETWLELLPMRMLPVEPVAAPMPIAPSATPAKPATVKTTAVEPARPDAASSTSPHPKIAAPTAKPTPPVNVKKAAPKPERVDEPQSRRRPEPAAKATPKSSESETKTHSAFKSLPDHAP